MKLLMAEKIRGSNARKSRTLWSDDAILAEAKRYQRPYHWQKASVGSYVAAKRRGVDFYKRCTAHMEVLIRRKWSNKDLLKDAKQFSTRETWAKSGTGYQVARARGKKFLDRCCAHMVRVKHKKYTKAEILKITKQFKIYGQFLRHPTYHAARAYGIEFCEKCSSHMKKAHRKWRDTEILAEAKKFRSTYEWVQHSNASYQSARRRGVEFLEICTSHMRPSRKIVSKDRDQKILASAKMFSSVEEWKKHSPELHFLARFRGREFYRECTAHMINSSAELDADKED